MVRTTNDLVECFLARASIICVVIANVRKTLLLVFFDNFFQKIRS